MIPWNHTYEYSHCFNNNNNKRTALINLREIHNYIHTFKVALGYYVTNPGEFIFFPNVLTQV